MSAVGCNILLDFDGYSAAGSTASGGSGLTGSGIGGGQTTSGGSAPGGHAGTGGSGGGGGTGGSGGTVDLDEWAYRKPLTISAAQIDAPGAAGSLTDFPVLIGATDSDLEAAAQLDGDDIVFTASDGSTVLAHDIERYDSGQLLAFVEIPALAEDADTLIYIYYGNPTVDSQANGWAVWSAGYETVFHLHQNPGPGGDGDMKDASAHHHGTAHAMEPADRVAGTIGDGIRFDSNDEHVAVEQTDFGDELTLAAWVKLANSNGQKTIVANSVSGGDEDGFRFFINTWTSDDGRVIFQTGNDVMGSKTVAMSPEDTIAADTWYHIAAVVNRGEGDTTIYVDGVDVTETSDTRTDFNSDSNWRMGSMESNNWGLAGALDELRTATTLRSAEWIATAYRNQSDPSEFVDWGDEESGPW